MTEEKKIEIVNSFPEQSEKGSLNFQLSDNEVERLRGGFYSNSMDEKWNIFLHEEIVYMARSWTGFCIYKLSGQHSVNGFRITDFEVNRNQDEYKRVDIELDSVTLRRILQSYLGREDLWIDERLELGLIPSTVHNLDPQNEFKKSIGNQSVALNKQVYKAIIANPNNGIEHKGVVDFINLLGHMNPDEELLSLHFSGSKATRNLPTVFFSKDATKKIAEVNVKMKKDDNMVT